jgi:cation transport ATPase
MADRERKRAQRAKRKRRGAERREQLAERRARMSERTEARNQAARDALEPLAEEERPTVVTVGAVISAVVSVSIMIGYAAGVEVRGEQPNVVQALAPAVIFAVMAWGMWKARYWAVLGFQTVMVLTLISASLLLVGATRWEQAVVDVILIAGCGALFYLNIKAMARIQMPDRTPRE